MRLKSHLRYLLLMVVTWCVFWLIGLPHYYQQYPTVALAIVSIGLQLGLSLLAIVLLSRGRPERRMARARWLAFYAVVPFAVLDTLYCGVYLGRGAAYLSEYWYLSVFYVDALADFSDHSRAARAPHDGAVARAIRIGSHGGMRRTSSAQPNVQSHGGFRPTRGSSIGRNPRTDTLHRAASAHRGFRLGSLDDPIRAVNRRQASSLTANPQSEFRAIGCADAWRVPPYAPAVRAGPAEPARVSSEQALHYRVARCAAICGSHRDGVCRLTGRVRGKASTTPRITVFQRWHIDCS